MIRVSPQAQRRVPEVHCHHWKILVPCPFAARRPIHKYTSRKHRHDGDFRKTLVWPQTQPPNGREAARRITAPSVDARPVRHGDPGVWHAA